MAEETKDKDKEKDSKSAKAEESKAEAKEEAKAEETKAESPVSDEGFVKPTRAKQAVIKSSDVEAIAAPTRRTFKIKIAGLRGQYQGVHFEDDFTADGVDADHFSSLRGHFGPGAIEVLEAPNAE